MKPTKTEKKIKLLCKLIGHKWYSPTMDFDLIYGNKKKWTKENMPICLRCGIEYETDK